MGQGRQLGVASSQSCGETVNFTYVASSVSQHVYIASIPCIITQAAYRTRVGSTSGTVQITKCIAATAPANGVVLCTAQDISATPAVDTTFNITLLPGNNNGNVTLNPGDAIALVFAGTLTSGVGMVQFFVEPLT
jgi:hypothetical protein